MLEKKLEYQLTPADIEYKRFGMGKENAGFFLPSSLLNTNWEPISLYLETDINSIKTTIRDRRSSYRISKGLKPWFKAHPRLKESDKVCFTVIKRMEKYSLEILQE
jgi:hypothetical protein